MSIDPAAIKSNRGSWKIFLPVILLAVLAAAWSVYWYIAARKAQASMDLAIQRQAERGVAITCGKRSFSGFPFRFELFCDEPKVHVSRDGHELDVTATRFAAVAQAYQPQKFIFEAISPLIVTNPEANRTVTVNWKSAQASGALWFDGPDHGAVVIEGGDASMSENGTAVPLGKADKTEFYFRRASGEGLAPGNYEVIGKLTQLSLDKLNARLQDNTPFQVDLRAHVSGLTDWRPRPAAVFFKDWVAGGGILTLEQLRIDRGPVSIVSSGTFVADQDGRVSGQDARVLIAGAPELAATISRSGLATPKAASFIGIGLNIVGKPNNIDGRDAIEVPVSLAAGRVGIGGFKILSLPPLFAATDAGEE